MRDIPFSTPSFSRSAVRVMAGLRALGGVFLITILALSAGLPGHAQQPRPEVASGETVVLRGLDKVSGETTDMELPVGGRATYARLEIAVIACRYPTEAPESDAMAFLEITHARHGEQLFRGWMFASSPALNALDDARYDIWVLSCR